MAISPALTFIGNGRPTRPATISGLNRESSARAIRLTTPRTLKEFRASVSREFQPDIRAVGRQAVAISKITGQGVDITV